MIYENEITVEISCNEKELLNILKTNNFKMKEQYDLIDYYLIKDYDSNIDEIELLKQCILIRHIIKENNEIKLITYKYKEINEKGEIINQGKINCKTESIDDAINIFEAIGYTKIMEIKDHITVYANNDTELSVQQVNNKHTYIEIEDKCHFINKTYSNIDEMKNEIKKYNIPIKDNNYFVKKAVIELKEIYN